MLRHGLLLDLISCCSPLSNDNIVVEKASIIPRGIISFISKSRVPFLSLLYPFHTSPFFLIVISITLKQYPSDGIVLNVELPAV
jgi:hypothetical protein